MITTRSGASVNGRHLGAFIAASIAVHCLLLAGWLQDDITPGAASTLEVTVLPSEQTSESVKQASNEHHSSKTTVKHVEAQKQTATVPTESATNDIATPRKNAPLQATAHENKTTQIAQSEPREPAVSTNVETAVTPTFSLGQTKERVSEQLHNELARHFHYPRLALLRGWEGTVLLDLQIETDGRISRVSLAQSSGYSLLDNSAIETLHRVGSVRDAARWLQNRSLELQLPVIYRLTAM
jgi:protein TonB